MSDKYEPSMYVDGPTTPRPQPGGGNRGPWILPDGSLVNSFEMWVAAWVWAGYGFNIAGGSGTTPFTFTGAFDATGPDLYAYIPSGYAMVPVNVEVVFDALGTEATVELIALASPVGDSSITKTGGADATITNMRIGTTVVPSSGLTAVAGVDASGITTPATGGTEFWRHQKPLADTVATGENDRASLRFAGFAFRDFVPPLIIGDSSDGASLSIYACSQAGTGFIRVQALVFPPSLAATMFGSTP